MIDPAPSNPPPEKPKRRPRYAGKNPRRFEDKYKEHQADKYPETIAKVIASGKTPAGAHRPIMVDEILTALQPAPGQLAIDCTLGHGGHAREILSRIVPAGRLIGIDADPIESEKTKARMRELGFGPEVFEVHRSNFAALSKILEKENRPGADLILADLGVSSMQLDNPARGFSVKLSGPLDMRMNPLKGQPASAFLQSITPEKLEALLRENADEPRAELLARQLAGRFFSTTQSLAAAIENALGKSAAEHREITVRRVFQAIRISVNEELSVLDSLLRQIPTSLLPGGRVAILSFHSGEDRRVKKAFEAGLHEGVYSQISPEVIRPSAGECHSNPRSVPAKLRWAIRNPALNPTIAMG